MSGNSQQFIRQRRRSGAHAVASSILQDGSAKQFDLSMESPRGTDGNARGQTRRSSPGIEGGSETLQETTDGNRKQISRASTGIAEELGSPRNATEDTHDKLLRSFAEDVDGLGLPLRSDREGVENPRQLAHGRIRRASTGSMKDDQICGAGSGLEPERQSPRKREPVGRAKFASGPPTIRTSQRQEHKAKFASAGASVMSSASSSNSQCSTKLPSTYQSTAADSDEDDMPIFLRGALSSTDARKTKAELDKEFQSVIAGLHREPMAFEEEYIGHARRAKARASDSAYVGALATSTEEIAPLSPVSSSIRQEWRLVADNGAKESCEGAQVPGIQGSKESETEADSQVPGTQENQESEPEAVFAEKEMEKASKKLFWNIVRSRAHTLVVREPIVTNCGGRITAVV